MLQELGFHVPRVQPGSYHIYERDSTGDEALRLGSPGDPVPINKYVLLRDCWSSVSDPPGILYLLISTCSSVIVGPPKNPLHL